ncbi:MAG: right-handed parallel beta-helix repeat-containing protein [Anaerolineales bacterium]|nr:right-handed parallel beta-helix repeat-containing protein [Anaerolineales bacterium]
MRITPQSLRITIHRAQSTASRLMIVRLVIGLALGLAAVQPAQAASLVVDTNNDVFDVAFKNCSTVVISDLPGSGGYTSLREAICAANNTASGAPHTILFNIGGGGGYEIALTSPLPEITRPMTIDATSQPGYAGTPLIELNGKGAGSGANGLTIQAGDSTVKGLVIHSFQGDGIYIYARGGNTIQGNYIGVDASGSFDMSNFGSGIYIEGTPNLIGGSTAATRNLISGNGGAGISIISYTFQPLGPEIVGNQVLGNYIGVDASGTGALGNDLGGITISGDYNTVGGTASGAGNLVSGNSDTGITINGDYNQVLGNKIGTDASGSYGIGNGWNGVTVYGSYNTIGGTTTGAGNLISANQHRGIAILADNNQVLGNKIGTNASGTYGLGNGMAGIYVTGGNNLIGGATSGAGNLVSGNFGHGVNVGGSENQVLGNKIGTDASGTQALGNFGVGISIPGYTNTIGAATAGAGNLISSNFKKGIAIRGDSNQVLGNKIGVDASGTQALGNGRHGVYLLGDDNIIGGASYGAGNLISSNNGSGVYILQSSGNQVLGNDIGVDASGSAGLGNAQNGVVIQRASYNFVSGAQSGAGNLISGNGSNGVAIYETSSQYNQVLGNTIGLTADGAQKLGNHKVGALIHEGQRNTIGGSNPGAGNLISGNGESGVAILGYLAYANQVLGNKIGVDASGTLALGNGNNGVYIQEAWYSLIGGATSGAGNLISGNDGYGVLVRGMWANYNQVFGNKIGVDAAGVAAIGNTYGGLFLDGAPDNTIGGSNAGEGNLISSNGGPGVLLSGGYASGNTLAGNRIGVNASGTGPLGNLDEGVSLWNAPNNTIGSDSSTGGNLISANGKSGVLIYGAGATGNLLLGNKIGADASGAAALGNALDGVLISDASGNSLGDEVSQVGNQIAYNGRAGVAIAGVASGNPIRHNSIFSNFALGIDLGSDGVSLNDAFDSDGGPNLLSNFPTLTSMSSGGGSLTINGTFNGLSEATIDLEFFANQECDGSKYGEGQLYLGSASITTNASGYAAINVTLPVSLPPGYLFISAVATDASGNSSEFSACYPETVYVYLPVVRK